MANVKISWPRCRAGRKGGVVLLANSGTYVIFTFFGIFKSDFPKYFSYLTWKLRLSFLEKILYQLLVWLAKKICAAFSFLRMENSLKDSSRVKCSFRDSPLLARLPFGPFIFKFTSQ